MPGRKPRCARATLFLPYVGKACVRTLRRTAVIRMQRRILLPKPRGRKPPTPTPLRRAAAAAAAAAAAPPRIAYIPWLARVTAAGRLQACVLGGCSWLAALVCSIDWRALPPDACCLSGGGSASGAGRP
eukprot:352171-Chlamydomonas_euryale.AAC.1